MEIRFGVLEAPGGITLNAPLTLNAGKIIGGTVTENGAARLKFTGEPANILDGVTVQGDLDLTNPGARLLIHNGLTVSGKVLIDGGGIGFEGNQTFDNATVVFTGTSGDLAAKTKRLNS